MFSFSVKYHHITGLKAIQKQYQQGNWEQNILVRIEALEVEFIVSQRLKFWSVSLAERSNVPPWVGYPFLGQPQTERLQTGNIFACLTVKVHRGNHRESGDWC